MELSCSTFFFFPCFSLLLPISQKCRSDLASHTRIVKKLQRFFFPYQDVLYTDHLRTFLSDISLNFQDTLCPSNNSHPPPRSHACLGLAHAVPRPFSALPSSRPAAAGFSGPPFLSLPVEVTTPSSKTPWDPAHLTVTTAVMRLIID